MRIALNQPYLFPYKGYFDLIASVDHFVLYDDAKFMKASYINRNNFPFPFTFRLRKHSDYAKINELYFYNVKEDVERLKKKGVKSKYLDILSDKISLDMNVYFTLRAICSDLGIKTPIHFSSMVPHRTGVEGIIDIVKHYRGDTYVNLPNGKKLYNQKQFGDIKLEFIETVPGPSIIV